MKIHYLQRMGTARSICRIDPLKETKTIAMTSGGEEYCAIRAMLSRMVEIHLSAHGLRATLDALDAVCRAYRAPETTEVAPAASATTEKSQSCQSAASFNVGPSNRWADLGDEDE